MTNHARITTSTGPETARITAPQAAERYSNGSPKTKLHLAWKVSLDVAIRLQDRVEVTGRSLEDLPATIGLKVEAAAMFTAITALAAAIAAQLLLVEVLDHLLRQVRNDYLELTSLLLCLSTRCLFR